MSTFLKKSRKLLANGDNFDLWIKCDGCGKTAEVYAHTTDRVLVHDFIKQYGWRTLKAENKWLNICPECKKALEERKKSIQAEKRAKFVNSFF